MTVEGVEIVIFPNVFSPKYFTDSIWFARTVARIVGNHSLLEIGTGTGIVAVFAGLNGAKVTATDINSDAVQNATYNFKNHNLPIDTYVGSLFDPLPKASKFEYIFWNHPFNFGENPDEEMLLKAGFDYHYESLDSYFAQAHLHLQPDGRLLLGTGNLALLSEIEGIANRHTYTMKLVESTKLPHATHSGLDEVCNVFEVYEFQR